MVDGYQAQYLCMYLQTKECQAGRLNVAKGPFVLDDTGLGRVKRRARCEMLSRCKSWDAVPVHPRTPTVGGWDDGECGDAEKRGYGHVGESS